MVCSCNVVTVKVIDILYTLILLFLLISIFFFFTYIFFKNEICIIIDDIDKEQIYKIRNGDKLLYNN